MKQRIIIILLCIFFSVCPIVNLKYTYAAVSDISNYWAGATVQIWIERGFATGYPDGKFRPYNNISRAEFFTLINKVNNYTSKKPISYADVNIEDWFYNAVAIAASAGYIQGYPDGTVKPNSPITREEAAVIIAKIRNLQFSPDDASAFKDSSALIWSKGSVGAVVANKIMLGYKDGTFLPQNPIDRGEAIVSLDRAFRPSEVNVTEFGVKGDGITDDTNAINKVIEYLNERGGGTINIPDGVYIIDPIKKIRLKSNVKMHLSENAILQSSATSSGSYSIINLWQVSNVDIVGGKIVGDRSIHQGVTGEWGFGISMFGCSNVYISDISIADCWGDGIYIGSAVNSDAPSVMYCDSVTIERVKIDNSRRDNISVISARNLIIKDCTLSNANGNIPQAGLNFEPNFSNEFMQNIKVENLMTINNLGYGIQLAYSLRNLANPVDITIINHNDENSHLAIGPWPLGQFELDHVVIR